MLRVHSIETLGAHDGPGIRTVFFLQGCPMRCIYCHNPDTFDAVGGKLYDEQQLCQIATRYKSYYGEQGGVTISGGEPLMQHKGVEKLILLLKKEGIHTALDTAGSIFCPDVLRLCDLVLLDIKHTDPAIYNKITSFQIDNTIKTLRFLQQNNIRFVVRQVILSGYTDNEQSIRSLARLAKGAQSVELLPFHNMGAHKYQRLNLEYKLADMEPPSRQTMLKLEQILVNELNMGDTNE